MNIMKKTVLIFSLSMIMMISGCQKNIPLFRMEYINNQNLIWHFSVINYFKGQVVINDDIAIKKLKLKLVYQSANKLEKPKVYEISDYVKGEPRTIYASIQTDGAIDSQKLFFRYSDNSEIIRNNDFIEFNFNEPECKSKITDDIAKMKKGEKRAIMTCGINIEELNFKNKIDEQYLALYFEAE
ncbi:MAG: hypothetical protein LBT75_01285 [Bacilli bacterium]|jgi:hypothetical protein|nr:hypothetical protein [Bacilli bacterium]